MDLQATEPLQISDAPIKIPNRIGPLKCRLQRWLDGREHSDLQPVDTNRVLVRPFTPGAVLFAASALLLGAGSFLFHASIRASSNRFRRAAGYTTSSAASRLGQISVRT